MRNGSAAQPMQPLFPMNLRLLGAGCLLVLGSACGDAADADEEVGTDAAFLSAADDETLDAADPPNNPDPPERTACKARGKTLSPEGMTFVIHISRKADKAAKELDHLKKVRGYIRARDIFMIEKGSPIDGKLHELFPCNSFHFIAYPDEFDDAMKSGDLVDGISIDWEGSQVDGNSQAFSVDKLSMYAKKIHAKNRVAGFVPAWKPRFVDAQVKKASNMDYELAQIQPACVNSPHAFASRAKDLLKESKAHGEGLRDLGFEISMDSFAVADNHVDAQRGAACTRAAYGKGARAIYIYGNGSDHLAPYFKELGKLGIRAAR